MADDRDEAAVSLFIVEDDPHFRETFIDAMELRGVSVSGAGSGFEGLKMLQTHRPAAIVLDLRLPDLDGFELCRRVKRMDAFKKTPVVFVTASSSVNDPRDRAEGLLAGASAILPKPISVEKLWTEISSLLA